jgi:two-component system, NtrC family, sensor kinase
VKIRWKISVLVAALFAVLAISEIYVAKDVLMPSFTELERREADVAMRRIDYAVKRAFEQLQLAATSWGNWSDTYQFAQDHNPRFVEVNLTPIGLKELVADIAVVEDLEGRILTSAGFDLRSGRPLELHEIQARIRNLPFPSHDDLVNGRMVSGFLRTEHGVLMLAASPILDGLGRGPTRGSVVMGKFLSDEELLRISAQAQANLSMSAPLAGSSPRQIVQTADVTRTSEILNDISSRPVVTLTVELPRDITARGHSAVQYASLYLIGAAILVVVVLAIILNQVVLNPLARMTRHAVEIGRNEDLTTRLNFGRHDEIGVLAREFDRMVARVAETRSQLVDQSFKAGFAELARGVLHNLGNAMTPIGVRLAVLRSRLTSIPAEDLALAAAELAHGSTDPQRRSDLDEFVRLACADLITTLNAAAEDVDLMTRQASLVQGALAEQMRSTGNEHVMESVRLRELLEQSLDVVPDVARQQLNLHAHQSLDDVGTVHVPRTVLSLVLQNFVINAADAIRETRKTQGSLVVTSEILNHADGRELVIRCTDDGIGIASENLQRIFEKGFSTKSRETNFGIGLHWCANAIGALGGRVWATSAGVGHGATLQVAIPLTAANSAPMTRAA